jgi:cytoskeletal protein CcmA (bactofilin family)
MFERNKTDQSNKDAEVLSIGVRHDDGGAVNRAATRSAAPTGDRGATTVIGRSIKINGELQGDEDMRIEGEVTGTIQLTNNTLTVGSEGKIFADVYAKSVSVEGVMEGDLYGSERVNIGNQAQVRGNIKAPRVSLEDGARFKGSIEMDPKAVEVPVGERDVADSSAATAAKRSPANATKLSGEKPAEKPKAASGNDPEKRESAAG